MLRGAVAVLGGGRGAVVRAVGGAVDAGGSLSLLCSEETSPDAPPVERRAMLPWPTGARSPALLPGPWTNSHGAGGAGSPALGRPYSTEANADADTLRAAMIPELLAMAKTAKDPHNRLDIWREIAEKCSMRYFETRDPEDKELAAMAEKRVEELKEMTATAPAPVSPNLAIEPMLQDFPRKLVDAQLEELPSEEEDGPSLKALTLPPESPPFFLIEGHHRTLYVRKAQEDIADIIDAYERAQQKRGNDGVIILGNPGIGKSWSLVLLLRRALERGRTVFFESVKQREGWLFERQGDGYVVTTYCNGHLPKHALERKETLYLFDPGETERGMEPVHKMCFTVIASSPNDANYKGSRKLWRGPMLIMPTWEPEEVELLLAHKRQQGELTPTEVDSARERMLLTDGLIRYALDARKYGDFVSRRNRALDVISQSTITSYMRPDTSAADETSSHTLIKLVPDLDPASENPYELREVQPLVKGNRELIWAQLVRNTSLEAHAVMGNSEAPSWMRGYLLEPVAMRHLQGKQTVLARSLEGPEDQQEAKVIDINMPHDIVQGEYVAECADDVTFWPMGNFPAVDGYIPQRRMGFNATVSASHGIKVTALRRFLKHLELDCGVSVTAAEPLDFFWVVPQNMFSSYKKQPFTSTEEKPLQNTKLAQCVRQWVIGVSWMPSVDAEGAAASASASS